MTTWLQDLRDALWPKRAKQYNESASAVQIVCPHCQRLTTHSCWFMIRKNKRYTCINTYDGPGCGRVFVGRA